MDALCTRLVITEWTRTGAKSRKVDAESAGRRHFGDRDELADASGKIAQRDRPGPPPARPGPILSEVRRAGPVSPR